MAEINEKELLHLAELARLNLEAKETAKLLGDLKKILDHFKELEKVDTTNVVPMTGGTALVNAWREDESRVQTYKETEKIVESFPEKEGRQNKVPGVFQ